MESTERVFAIIKAHGRAYSETVVSILPDLKRSHVFDALHRLEQAGAVTSWGTRPRIYAVQVKGNTTHKLPALPAAYEGSLDAERWAMMEGSAPSNPAARAHYESLKQISMPPDWTAAACWWQHGEVCVHCKGPKVPFATTVNYENLNATFTETRCYQNYVDWEVTGEGPVIGHTGLVTAKANPVTIFFAGVSALSFRTESVL